MYQVIARKYRPRTFAELVGQGHVRSTLGNAISQGRIAHGYIFAGQRGTGKTTVARIMARCLNCEKGPTAEPCMECSACREVSAGNCIDVIEIDAASNRGINEMRELRENVRFRPARDRFKVFIIDEAHMITNEAFNALLKTLEEPPEWVAFILCTTESHKIPSTIASRCQSFSFRSVDFDDLVERMTWICGEEGIEADPDALAVIARAGEGSVRDSLSALDQAIACCGTKLEAGAVRELLGMFSVEGLGEVTAALEAGDGKRMLEIVLELESNGRNPQHYCRELARYFRNLLVLKLVGPGTRLVAASALEQQRMSEAAAKFSEDDLTRFLHITLDLYRDLQYSLQPRLHLELGLLRLIHASRLTTVEKALAGLGPAPAAAPPSPPPPPARAVQQAPPQTMAYRQTTAAAPPPPPPQPPPPEPPRAITGDPGALKNRLLKHFEAEGMTMLADAVEHSDVRETPGEITFAGPPEFGLTFRDSSMQAAVRKVAGRMVKVTFVAGTSGAAPKAPPPAANDEASRRALEHPEVRRFQELFPDAQIRNVRNLKE